MAAEHAVDTEPAVVHTQAHPLAIGYLHHALHVLDDADIFQLQRIPQNGSEACGGTGILGQKAGVAQEGECFRHAAGQLSFAQPDEAEKPFPVDGVVFLDNADQQPVFAPALEVQVVEPLVDDVLEVAERALVA